MTLPTLRTTLRMTGGLLVGLSSIITARDALLEVHHVTGSSMSPALSPGYHATGAKDHLLVTKLAATAAAAGGLRRGDVVSFWTPYRPDEQAVKRVVGTPGDVVATRGRYPWRAVKVPHGHLWVEGDNEGMSRDSNDYGPIPMGLITGKAVCIVWPWERIGRVPDVQRKTHLRVTDGVPELPLEYRD